MLKSNKATPDTRLEDLQGRCRISLYAFACAVEPHRVWGECHRELFEFWQKSDVDDIDNTLALMPRDHQKSHALAVRCCWEIYKNPAITIIYLSATSGLAERQLLDIQNIMESRFFRRLSPDMINKDKGKRAMWNTTGIAVDHPKREAEGVRDPTVSTCGLTTNTTGWHCVFLAKDDVVVPENAYTLDGRKKVESGCSQFASILTTGGKECAVGTRYHPKDHYATLKSMTESVRDEYDEIIDERNVYAVHERQVETDGVFLWARSGRKSDGKMFGFNFRELDRKKAKYTDRLQFFAQYYNNPNDLENRSVERGNFQYYKREHIFMQRGYWYYGKKLKHQVYEDSSARKLNVYAAMDFAYSLGKKADWTCIVVFGIDFEFNVYILDIIRFKTVSTMTYFRNFQDMLIKWEFSRLRAEVTAAQAVIVKSLKDKAMEEGLHCKIDEHRPNKSDGAKKERIDAALVPRYEEGKIYHYKGGLCTYLEEEILLDTPEHDDISDTLAAGLSSEFIRKPRRPSSGDVESISAASTQYHSRFGGAI